MMIKDPNDYFIDGCGRCSLHGTDQCKVRTWADPLVLLREIMLQSGLEEEAKWGQPTYTLKGKNIAMIFSFKAIIKTRLTLNCPRQTKPETSSCSR